MKDKNTDGKNYVFQTIKITKKFKKFIALKDVSIKISDGSFHGIVGENGSGKSTISKIIMGTYSPYKYNGYIMRSQDSTISFFPENAAFPIRWSVYKYLLNIAMLHLKDIKISKIKTYEVIESMGILNIKDKPANSLSSGQKKKVLLARAIIEDSKVLILDEPAANLDIASRRFLFKKISELNKSGKTIILISHLLKEINEYINEVTILNLGVVHYNGKIKKGTLEKEYDKVFKKI